MGYVLDIATIALILAPTTASGASHAHVPLVARSHDRVHRRWRTRVGRRRTDEEWRQGLRRRAAAHPAEGAGRGAEDARGAAGLSRRAGRFRAAHPLAGR